MNRKWREAYVDRLLDGTDVMHLSDLSAVLCASDRYDPAADDCGLPTFAFVFDEVMRWAAHSQRSGCLTYYESTSPERQAATLAGLRAVAPEAYAEAYERGSRGWANPAEAAAVDDWLDAKRPAIAIWARHLMVGHRDELMRLA